MLRLALLVTLVPLAALAQECALDAKAITSQVAAKLPKGVKLTLTKKEKRKVTQVVKLADGNEVTITFGGCERVQYSFGIKGSGLNVKTVGAEVLAVARKVLPQLPMGKDAMAEPKVLLTALDEGSFTSLPATLSCGPGTCKVELVAEPTKKKGKPAKGKGTEKDDDSSPATLVLSYDAPI